MSAAASWESWAPPLSPPTDGGLPVRRRAGHRRRLVGRATRTCARRSSGRRTPRPCRPTLAVAQVSTGVQSVSLRAGDSRRGAGRGDDPRRVAPLVPLRPVGAAVPPSRVRHEDQAAMSCPLVSPAGTGTVPSTAGTTGGAMRTAGRCSPGPSRCRRAGQRSAPSSSPATRCARTAAAPGYRGAPRPRTRGRARAGQPPVAVPLVPRDDHRPGGRLVVAVAGVTSGSQCVFLRTARAAFLRTVCAKTRRLFE